MTKEILGLGQIRVLTLINAVKSIVDSRLLYILEQVYKGSKDSPETNMVTISRENTIFFEKEDENLKNRESFGLRA
jgi:hypothetical protein